MEEEYNSLCHAEHNAKICRHLFDGEEFTDWVITTAFYSSMHYLRHKIFPLEIIKDGRKITVNDFEEYCIESNIKGKRHSEMRKLVENQCEGRVSSKYNQMLDLSWTARYSKYRFSRKAAETAMKRLGEIEQYAKE